LAGRELDGRTYDEFPDLGNAATVLKGDHAGRKAFVTDHELRLT